MHRSIDQRKLKNEDDEVKRIENLKLAATQLKVKSFHKANDVKAITT